LVRVTVIDLPYPTATFPKLRLVGETLAWRIPVPDKVIFCGLLVALSEIEMDWLADPVTVGANVAVIVQNALRISEPGQLCVIVNGAEDGVMLLMMSVVVLVLVSLTDFDALVVPTAWFPKFMLVALSEAVCPCSRVLAQIREYTGKRRICVQCRLIRSSVLPGLKSGCDAVMAGEKPRS